MLKEDERMSKIEAKWKRPMISYLYPSEILFIAILIITVLFLVVIALSPNKVSLDCNRVYWCPDHHTGLLKFRPDESAVAIPYKSCTIECDVSGMVYGGESGLTPVNLGKFSGKFDTSSRSYTIMVPGLKPGVYNVQSRLHTIFDIVISASERRPAMLFVIEDFDCSCWDKYSGKQPVVDKGDKQ